MRTFVLMALICSTSIYSSAIKISNEILRTHDETTTVVNSEHIFIDKDILTFKLEQPNEVVDWKLLLYKTIEPNTFIEVLGSTESCQNFIINLNDIDWNFSPHIFSYLDNPSQYYKGIVQISKNEAVIDSVEIILDLLPAKMIIDNVSFEYKYNWENDAIWPNGYIEIGIKTNTKTSDHYTACYSICELFEPPSWFGNRIPIENLNLNQEGIFYYSDHDVDWGYFLYFEARNKYGITQSDTICTTDYITDPDVLARLKELENEYHEKTSLPVNEQECVRITKYGNTIEITNIMEQITTIKIFDIAGHPVISNMESTHTIDVTFLQNGYYILTCKTETNKIYNLKFIKS